MRAMLRTRSPPDNPEMFVRVYIFFVNLLFLLFVCLSACSFNRMLVCTSFYLLARFTVSAIARHRVICSTDCYLGRLPGGRLPGRAIICSHDYVVSRLPGRLIACLSALFAARVPARPATCPPGYLIVRSSCLVVRFSTCTNVFLPAFHF